MQKADSFDLRCRMTLADWTRARGTAIIPDDGFGFYGTEVSISYIDCFEEQVPVWATHVYWYNK